MNGNSKTDHYPFELFDPIYKVSVGTKQHLEDLPEWKETFAAPPAHFKSHQTFDAEIFTTLNNMKEEREMNRARILSIKKGLEHLNHEPLNL